MTAGDAMIYDVVDEADFEERVIGESAARAVVVDFWAPWCAPCRALSPVLDKVVGEFGGGLALAKVNVDKAPALAAKYGVRGIPAVKVFRDGRVEAEFVGAVGEAEVRRVFARFVPSEADLLVTKGAALTAEGRREEAEAAYREALVKEPEHDGALVGLALAAMEGGDPAAARDAASRVDPGSSQREAADRVLAWVDLREECDGPGGVEAAEKRVTESPGDLDAAYALAVCLAANGRHEAALQKLLGIIRRDKAFRDGAAKEAMLKVFAVAGKRGELADEYRSKLAQALY